MRRVAACLVFALVLAACGGGASEPTGEVVEIFGPYRGEQADLFVASLREAPQLDGIEVRYTGSRDFVADLLTRIRDDADPPDLAVVPQPGVVAELAGLGALAPLGTATQAALDANLVEQARSLGAIDGEDVAVPYRVTVKSLVWYRPALFAERGWSVPGTWDELVALVDDIAADPGIAPWCFGLQAGTATGWAATDWVEDVVLRRQGSDVYDGWVAGTVPFADERVAAAFDAFASLVVTGGRSAGGREAILQTPVDAVAAELLAEPARCAMYKQSDLAIDWFPDGTTVGPDGDVDWFVLPGSDAGDALLVVGADLVVPFDDRPAVDAVLAVLASPEGSAAWRSTGSFVSPLAGAVSSDDDSVTAQLTRLVVNADVVRFDASDAMPASVGTSPFWSAITRWVGGSLTYDALAADLDARFPR
jgi:alpha-glucoside transport system substrate-binding protein